MQSDDGDAEGAGAGRVGQVMKPSLSLSDNACKQNRGWREVGERHTPEPDEAGEKHRSMASMASMASKMALQAHRARLRALVH
jgi:hypothetical protein